MTTAIPTKNRVPYTDHFQLADDYLAHVDTVIGTIADPFIKSRYSGSLAVSAVTVYELAIKTIFFEFAATKHKVLGNFTSEYFARINGRIKVSVLKEEYIPKFGEKYLKRFDRKLAAKEKEILQAESASVLSCYANVVTWRNNFAHDGVLPATATYEEVKKAYHCGKHVIHCLAESMTR